MIATGPIARKEPIGTVLLVDDYQPQLTMWARELESSGRAVATACTHAEALQVARELRPSFAVVDLFLGADDGLECVRCGSHLTFESSTEAGTCERW